MVEYDVVVVGAGPGGCRAAWRAAELDARTLLLEEHAAIGVPQHCSGLIHGSSHAERVFSRIGRRVVLQDYVARRTIGPDGETISEQSVSGIGHCNVQRDAFDRELARQAILAGAELALNVRVTGLLLEGDATVGVTTTSGELPEVRARVVIAADGTRAMQKGIPKLAGLTPPGQRFENGLNVELTGLSGIEPGVLYVFKGPYVEGRDHIVLYTQDGCSSFLRVPALRDFELLKNQDSPLGRVLKHAKPLRILGWSRPYPYGRRLPKIYKSGLLLLGDAAGYCSAISAIATGELAAEVAVEAIQAGDVDSARMRKYQELCDTLEGPLEQQYGFKLSRSIGQYWPYEAEQTPYELSASTPSLSSDR